MRIGGSAGVVMQRLGLLPLQLAGGDIYAALEDGTIDAAEWVGPYDDERLGLYKVAKYYYYPGWWEGGPEIDLFVNTKAWADLPKDYQAILEAACAEANVDMMAKYDARNPAALRRLVAAGVQLRAVPARDHAGSRTGLRSRSTTNSRPRNAKFKKVYEPWKKFRDEEILWFRVAEENFDQFMAWRAGTGPGEEVAAAATRLPPAENSPTARARSAAQPATRPTGTAPAALPHWL